MTIGLWTTYKTNRLDWSSSTAKNTNAVERATLVRIMSYGRPRAKLSHCLSLRARVHNIQRYGFCSFRVVRFYFHDDVSRTRAHPRSLSAATTIRFPEMWSYFHVAKRAAFTSEKRDTIIGRFASVNIAACTDRFHFSRRDLLFDLYCTAHHNRIATVIRFVIRSQSTWSRVLFIFRFLRVLTNWN